MSEPHKVLLVTQDAATSEAVTEAIEGLPGFTLGKTCRTLAELRVRLDIESVAMVLVDTDPQPAMALAELEPLVAGHVQTRFAILTGSYETQLVLRAMRIGMRHVQLKSSIHYELAGALSTLLPNNQKNRPSTGTLVTVFSAGGGAGATTISVNLACDLVTKDNSHVLLVDSDLHYGAVAPCLGLEGRYGLSEVLNYGERIDAELLQTTAVSFEERLDVLLSPATCHFGWTAELKLEHLEHFLGVCREAYDFTIIDAPRLPLEATTRLARDCNLVVIALQLSVKDVHMTRSLVSTLRAEGVRADRILLAVNRYERQSPVKIEDLRSLVGDLTIARIRNDWRNACRFTTFGQTLPRAAARSPLGRDLTELADLVRQIHHQKQRNGASLALHG